MVSKYNFVLYKLVSLKIGKGGKQQLGEYGLK